MPKLTSKKVALITIISLSSSLLLINRIAYFKPSVLETIVSNITYPIMRVSTMVTYPIRTFLAKRATITELQQQLNTMYLNHHRLISENNKLKALARYAHNTKPLRLFLERYDENNGSIARIFQKILNHQEQTMLINTGSRDGIEVDSIAVYCNQIVGRITDVYPFYSKIMLITDHNAKVSGVTDDNKASGIVTGANKPDNLKFAYISHLIPISQNQLVLSSGDSKIFPEGFALGTITKHSTDGLVHDIDLKPTINLSTLDYCIVLQRKKITAL